MLPGCFFFKLTCKLSPVVEAVCLSYKPMSIRRDLLCGHILSQYTVSGIVVLGKGFKMNDTKFMYTNLFHSNS